MHYLYWKNIKAALAVATQVVLFCLVWLLGSQISDHFLPFIPASVLGLVIMLLIVWSKIIPPIWYLRGAYWLLAEMLLFFIPAVVAVIQYKTIILSSGVKILAVIVLSTLLVMVVTGFVVEVGYKLEAKWHNHHPLDQQKESK